MRDWLTIARWPADRIEDVVLAVSEAVSNAMEHAHHATTPAPLRMVDVHAVIEPNPERPPVTTTEPRPGDPHMRWQAQIAITDHGRWRPPAVDLEDPHRARGWGLLMMRKLMDQVLIDHGTDSSGGTRVTLITSATLRSPG